MRVDLNELFIYDDGKLIWKDRKQRGFNKSGQQAGAFNQGRMYVKSNLLHKKYYARSHIVWEMHNGEIPTGMLVDHIDRDPLNDRLENLRLLTFSENLANTEGKCSKKSGLPKGVYKCTEEGKFRFQVMRGGKIVASLYSVPLAEAEAAAQSFFEAEGLYIKESDL